MMIRKRAGNGSFWVFAALQRGKMRVKMAIGELVRDFHRKSSIFITENGMTLMGVRQIDIP